MTNAVAATFVAIPVVRRWCAYAAIAVAAGILLSACAPMRVYPGGHTESGLAALKSRPLPDVTPNLPADLRASTDEVLVLIQTSRFTYSGMGYGGRAGDVALNSVAARFMKGNELPSLSKTLTLDSGSGLVFFIPLMVTGIPLGGASTYERLEVLCAVAQDGRVIVLYPNAAPQQQFLTRARKDAIVSALRAPADAGFEDTDGPCGVVGTLGWSDELRAKVSDFIARVPTPDRQSAAERSITEVIRASGAITDESRVGTARAMLLAETHWRSTIAERPLSLRIEDFDTFANLLTQTDARALVSELPGYRSGTRAMENVVVEEFCVLSADGRALRWSREGRWVASDFRMDTTLETGVPAREWKYAALSVLRTNGWGPERDVGCIPNDLGGWSEADRSGAAAFIDALPFAQHGAALEAALRDRKGRFGETALASEADVAVLAVAESSRMGIVVVPVLLHGGDAMIVTEAIRATTPREFMASLRATSAGSRMSLEGREVSHVCVIGSKRLVELGREGRAGWTMPHEEALTDKFVGDVLAILASGERRYAGTYICFVNEAHPWPDDIGRQMAAFLGTVISR